MTVHHERLGLRVTDDGHIDGQHFVQEVRTHSAVLWFTDDLVVKRKRPVDLGFLDFRTLDARIRACSDELALNRRMSPEAYLGLVDVLDEQGEVVDVSVVMRRLPEESRLETLAREGAELDECVRAVAREVAVFHAGQPPASSARETASAAALATNWADNLAVLGDHAHLVDPATVTTARDQVTAWLAGREQLLEERIDAGLVRDGHGDLLAADIFCMPDGPLILDCLDFDARYRIADVLMDVAFLAMDLERLGRADLARTFLTAHADFAGARQHSQGLAHHYIAYRAGVRAKVACLADQPSREKIHGLVTIMTRHLDLARPRLVLVGGLPGTGKSTVAAALSDRLGWALLRTDELRKDLLGIGHHEPAGPDAYRPRMSAATYAELLDRARELLQRGESVVLDASWSDATHREVAAGTARAATAELLTLRCQTPRRVAHERLLARRGDPSDAGVVVHDEMALTFADWPEATVLDTSATLDQVLPRALAAVGMDPATPLHQIPTMETDMSGFATDRQGLEVLDMDTCMQLLDLSPVGRLAFVEAGEPIVLPVNFVRDGQSVLFRTATGKMLDAASQRRPVAFEVDGYDADTRTGWSVVLRGKADLETDEATIARLEETGLEPWADSVERPNWVRVRPTEVSGRRIPDRD